MMKINWGGVDFGAKLAGTTAITYILEDQIKIAQTTKGQDADKWLVKIIKENNLDYIFIDAPLSLPGAFLEKETILTIERRTDSRMPCLPCF